MQFLSFLLCFELVLGPVQGSLLLPGDAYAQKDCPAGQAYDASLNRCITKAEVIEMNDATQDCGGNKDCYKQNSDDAMKEQETKGNVKAGNANGFKIKGAGVAAIAIPLVIVTSVLLQNQKSKKAGAAGFSCKPISLLLMYGAAAALGVGEIYGYFNHRAKLKKIQKDWDKTVVPKDGSGIDKKKTEAIEAQSEAFEFLAQNEDQVGKTSKTKKGFYIAASGLFAAGAIAAVVEMVQLKAAIAEAAVPATALSGQQKIAKLTCHTQSGEDNKTKQENDKLDKLSEKEASDEETAKHTAATEKETAAKEARQSKINENETKQSGLNNLIAEKEELMSKNGPSAETKVKLQTEIDNMKKQREALENENIKLNNELNPPAPSSKLPPDFYKDFPSCQKAGYKWNISLKFCGLTSINDDKMKRVAAHNISKATDLEQMLELLKEYESIEFENYSKVSYLSNEEKGFKHIPLDSEISGAIAEALLPTAHAEEEKKDTTGKVLGTVATALPLVGGLKSILGWIKFNGGTPLKAGELDKIHDSAQHWVMKMIGKPVTRLAINGVLGGWMALMAVHMDKQQKLAETRSVKLREMKEEFNSANGFINCKEEDRLDASKPKCYCFTPENKVNPARSKDAVCSNSFAKIKYDPFGQGKGSDKVCLDQNQNMDAACACRAKKSCMKISSGFTMSGFKPGSFKMISAGSAPAQDLFNGNLGGGDIADSAGINAARIKAAADDMLAKVDPKAFKQMNGLSSNFEKALIAGSAGLSMGASAGSSALPTTPAAAAAALDKELKENKEAEITTSGGTDSAAGNFNATEEEPEFGMTSEQAAEQEIEIAEVMGQEIDTGNSDINSGSKTNIFEVLSNRYQRSGVRRLFNEENKAPADAPDKSELTE